MRVAACLASDQRDTRWGSCVLRMLWAPRPKSQGGSSQLASQHRNLDLWWGPAVSRRGRPAAHSAGQVKPGLRRELGKHHHRRLSHNVEAHCIRAGEPAPRGSMSATKSSQPRAWAAISSAPQQPAALLQAAGDRVRCVQAVVPCAKCPAPPPVLCSGCAAPGGRPLRQGLPFVGCCRQLQAEQARLEAARPVPTNRLAKLRLALTQATEQLRALEAENATSGRHDEVCGVPSCTRRHMLPSPTGHGRARRAPTPFPASPFACPPHRGLAALVRTALQRQMRPAPGAGTPVRSCPPTEQPAPAVQAQPRIRSGGLRRGLPAIPASAHLPLVRDRAVDDHCTQPARWQHLPPTPADPCPRGVVAGACPQGGGGGRGAHAAAPGHIHPRRRHRHRSHQVGGGRAAAEAGARAAASEGQRDHQHGRAGTAGGHRAPHTHPEGSRPGGRDGHPPGRRRQPLRGVQVGPWVAAARPARRGLRDDSRWPGGRAGSAAVPSACREGSCAPRPCHQVSPPKPSPPCVAGDGTWRPPSSAPPRPPPRPAGSAPPSWRRAWQLRRRRTLARWRPGKPSARRSRSRSGRLGWVPHRS